MEALEIQQHLDNQKTLSMNCQHQQQQQLLGHISFTHLSPQDATSTKTTNVTSKASLNTPQTMYETHLTQLMNNTQSYFYFGNNDDSQNQQHQYSNTHQNSDHYQHPQLSHQQPQQGHSVQNVDYLTNQSHAHHANLNQCDAIASGFCKEVTSAATDNHHTNYVDGNAYQMVEQQHQRPHWPAALSKTSDNYLNIARKYNDPTNHVPNTLTNGVENTLNINTEYDHSAFSQPDKSPPSQMESTFYHPINTNNQLETECSSYTNLSHKNFNHTLVNDHHHPPRHSCQQYSYSYYDDHHQHQQENMQGNVQSYYKNPNPSQQHLHEDQNTYREPYSYYESRVTYSSSGESSMQHQHQHQHYTLNTHQPVLTHGNYYSSRSSFATKDTKHSLPTIPMIDEHDTNNNNNCAGNWSPVKLPASQRNSESLKKSQKEPSITGAKLQESTGDNKNNDDCLSWKSIHSKTSDHPTSSDRNMTALIVVKKDEEDKKLDILTNSGGKGFFGTQRINQCRVCGRNYARPSTLKTHLRTHTNERPFKCNVCHKTFSQAANLTAHQRVHTGERPFSCPICGRQFSQSSSVITHLRTHSGERPYRCNMCSRTFSDSSTLTKHCRIHSGEKPYQCDYCPLNFSQSGNLSRHLKLHLMNSSGSTSIASGSGSSSSGSTTSSSSNSSNGSSSSNSIISGSSSSSSDASLGRTTSSPLDQFNTSSVYTNPEVTRIHT